MERFMGKHVVVFCTLVAAVFQLCGNAFCGENLKNGDVLVYAEQEGQGFKFDQEQGKNGYIGDFVRWAQYDIGHIPAKDSWLFVGSSSMRMWRNIHDNLAPLNILHRGFGGSTMRDVVRFKNFFARYKASNIVVYEGDNDLNTSDLTKVDAFLKNCREFIDYIHQSQPDTMIYFLSPKPCIRRWAHRATYEKARVALKAMTDQEPKVAYIDIATPMLGNDGTPKKDIFLGDKLHMNLKGYEIWTGVIRKALGLKANVAPEAVSNTPEITDIANPDHSFFINFGGKSGIKGWNSVTSSAHSGKLVNIKGEKTGVALKITSKFNGTNNSGTKQAKKELNLPSKASANSFYGMKGNETCVFEVSGLSKDKQYQLSFFASRMGANDNRETTYSVSGASTEKVSLNATGNTDKVAEIAGVRPAENGTIVVTVSKGEHNTNSKGYFYLGALKISPTD
jgi:lysophospholipase L1-like esterase